VLPDTEVSDATRILICSGKIVHELRAERKKRNDQTTAIVSVEQLYPFPEKELESAIGQFASAREIVWVQEEPANMGALFYVLPRLRRIAGERPVLSVKRSASASPPQDQQKPTKWSRKPCWRWPSRIRPSKLEVCLTVTNYSTFIDLSHFPP